MDSLVLGRKASKPVQIPPISELAPEKAAKQTKTSFSLFSFLF